MGHECGNEQREIVSFVQVVANEFYNIRMLDICPDIYRSHQSLDEHCLGKGLMVIVLFVTHLGQPTKGSSSFELFDCDTPCG